MAVQRIRGIGEVSFVEEPVAVGSCCLFDCLYSLILKLVDAKFRALSILKFAITNHIALDDKHVPSIRRLREHLM